MYEAIVIAMYIVDHCFRSGTPISNLRLQKLLYFVQGQSYIKNDDCIIDEDFYAWPYGPVIPTVYYKYCGFAGAPIRMAYDPGSIKIAEKDAELIEDTIERFSPYTDWQLVEFTHEEGAPWFKYKTNRELIPKKDIRDYFISLKG